MKLILYVNILIKDNDYIILSLEKEEVKNVLKIKKK